MTTLQSAPPLTARLAAFAADIKLSHTVFALPFALLATVLAGERVGGLRPGQVGLIVACMVFARTAAMAANRLLDADLDAANPRTAGRAIPAGRTPRGFVALMLAGSAIAFVATTAGFLIFYGNGLPLLLSGPVLAFLCAYPLLKRFTALCHYYLGLALALAPVCAQIAVAGNVSAAALWMAAGVWCWTAGFDILYGCQDYAHDRAAGVRSVPARLGVARALWVARATHALAAACLFAVGVASPALGSVYYAGVALASVVLVAEHAIVRADDLSRLNLAFFTLNGVVSVTIGTLGIIDVYR